MTEGFSLRNAVAADRAEIVALLRASDLPVDGVDDATFVVAIGSGAIVGCAALEHREDAGLLRSVAVDKAWRGRGVGRALVAKVVAGAADAHIDPIVLLTTTAPDWFTRYGFARITRDVVPAPLLESAEFCGACPDTAVIMRRTTAGIDERR